MKNLTYEEFKKLLTKYEAGFARQDELDLLEPYRAKRAVLLASGLGSRLAPITINTPKPLIEVNGRRIISTILDALLSIDVTEIYIVTGYKRECFEILKKDYPTITSLKNFEYKTTNNISSACIAKNYFQNAYVFESDLFIKNANLLKKYHYHSSYMGVPVSSTTDWCFDTKDGIVTDLHKGGTNCHHMFGVSYWTKEDGAKLAVDLPKCFAAHPENQQRFWDDVPCVIRRKNYKIHIEECSFEDIDEIDSFAELQKIDERYKI